MFFFNSNTLVCLSLSTGTRLRWRSIATSSPFRKKTHYHFYDSTHGWTNDVVEILQREVSWARVREIFLQNDPALFRPKSKKTTGNSTTTFNVVTSQARKNTKCSSDLFFLKTNIDNGGPCRQSVDFFFCRQSVIFFLFCLQSVFFQPLSLVS